MLNKHKTQADQNQLYPIASIAPGWVIDADQEVGLLDSPTLIQVIAETAASCFDCQSPGRWSGFLL